MRSNSSPTRTLTGRVPQGIKDMGGKAAESDEDKMVDAARHGRFQEVRDWLAKGVDVNYYSDDGGRSVFVRACTRAHACVCACASNSRA